MSPEERKKWVARGFQDPKRAYLQNIGSARKRGIEFKLTFDEWWALWEPHYEKRGQHIDCMALCRTKDKGAPPCTGKINGHLAVCQLWSDQPIQKPQHGCRNEGPGGWITTVCASSPRKILNLFQNWLTTFEKSGQILIGAKLALNFPTPQVRAWRGFSFAGPLHTPHQDLANPEPVKAWHSFTPTQTGNPGWRHSG
jgi:hypothetical protein